jgi:hypothetical protein
MQQALAPHRTLTHSFFTILALALVGLLPWKTAVSKSVGGGLFGVAIGMFVHVLLDLPYKNRCLSPLASNITEVRIVVVADMNLGISRPDLGFPVRCNILLRPSQTRKEVPDARQTVDPGGSRLHHRVPSDGRLGSHRTIRESMVARLRRRRSAIPLIDTDSPVAEPKNHLFYSSQKRAPSMTVLATTSMFKRTPGSLNWQEVCP